MAVQSPAFADVDVRVAALGLEVISSLMFFFYTRGHHGVPGMKGKY